MKEEMHVVYAPVKAGGKEITEKLLPLFLESLEGGLNAYYAKLQFDSKEDSFVRAEEELNLKSREDLLTRLARDDGGLWSADINLGFYPVQLQPALFRDPPGGPTTTMIASIDSSMATFLLEEARPRLPFLTFLARIGLAIDSDWFLLCLELVHWRALQKDQLYDQGQWPRLTYAIGWKDGALDEQRLLQSSGREASDVKRSTLGFRFLDMFPSP
jgi:hypothetical protein